MNGFKAVLKYEQIKGKWYWTLTVSADGNYAHLVTCRQRLFTDRSNAMLALDVAASKFEQYRKEV